MKVTIEFEHPCELIDLMRKMSDVMIKNEPVQSNIREPTMSDAEMVAELKYKLKQR